jgi:hypothetical protein
VRVRGSVGECVVVSVESARERVECFTLRHAAPGGLIIDDHVTARDSPTRHGKRHA